MFPVFPSISRYIRDNVVPMPVKKYIFTIMLVQGKYYRAVHKMKKGADDELKVWENLFYVFTMFSTSESEKSKKRRL